MRSKVYDVRDNILEVVEARRVGGSYEDSESNPLHLRSVGSSAKTNFDANPFSQQSSAGGLEMTPIPNLTMPRVFNGDYRQLPITADEDQLI